MITAVVFDDTIPLDVNIRESRFYLADGWDIREVSPGRIELRHETLRAVVTSQGLPYTLWTLVTEYARPGVGGVISEATLGNRELSAEKVIAAGKHGRRRP